MKNSHLPGLHQDAIGQDGCPGLGTVTSSRRENSLSSLQLTSYDMHNQTGRGMETEGKIIVSLESLKILQAEYVGGATN